MTRHPGKLLRFRLIDLGVSVSDAAEWLGVGRTGLSQVLNGHARITLGLALRLEGMLGEPAQVWLARQAAYDLARARKRGMPSIKRYPLQSP